MTTDEQALMRARDEIYNMPPRYPSVGHQYICGYKDAVFDALAVIDAVIKSPPAVPASGQGVDDGMDIGSINCVLTKLDGASDNGAHTVLSLWETRQTAKALRRILSTPPAPEAGKSVDVEAIVIEAMEDGWNDICADTGCHPQDIRREGKNLRFEPYHWARFTAERVAHKLRGYLAAAPVVGENAQIMYAVKGPDGLYADRLGAIFNPDKKIVEGHARALGEGYTVLPVAVQEISDTPPPAREQGEV